MRYSASQLYVLYCLRRHGGKIVKPKGVGSIYGLIADETRLRRGTVKWALQTLETSSIVIRNYKTPHPGVFGSQMGQNPLLSVEMVDPDMELPPCPAPLPLAVVIAHENEELSEMTAHEPERDDVIEALLNRNEELQGQIDRLREIVEQLVGENEALKKRIEKKKVPEHLTSRIQDALTPEKWEELRHQGK